MQHVFAFIGNLSCVIGKKGSPASADSDACNWDTSLSANICCIFFKQRTQFVSTLIQPGIFICFFHFKASQRDTVYKLFEIK